MADGKKYEWLKYVPIGVIIASLITVGIFAYNELYEVPVLSYEKLDPYPISSSERIVPVIIRNEGQDVATDVRVTINTAGKVTNIQFESPEEVNVVGNGTSTIIANFPRIIHGTQINFYLRIETESVSPINNVWITSNEVTGIDHKSRSDITVVTASIGVIVGIIASLMGFLAERTLKRYKKTSKITPPSPPLP